MKKEVIAALVAAGIISLTAPAFAGSPNMFGGSEKFRIATTPPHTWVWSNKLGKAVPGPKPTAEEVNEGYEGGSGENDSDDD